MPAGTGNQIRVVVEDGSVTDHHFIRGLCRQLFGNLRVKNPRLRRESGFFIDRQRAAPRDLFHQLDSEIESLELRSEIEAESGFPYPVCANERDLETASAEGIERKKLASL